MVTSVMESGQGNGSARIAGPGRAVTVGDREVEAEDRFRKFTLPVDAPDTGRAAREMVSLTLNAWGLGPLVDDVRSCVAELVGNVREHAFPDERSPLRRPLLSVTLRLWPGWLLVDVADEDSTPPTLPEGEPFAPEFAEELPEALLPNSGRGLGIVRCLSDFVWWAPRDEGGKSVFCRFDLDGRSVSVLPAAARP
jgi:Histidine kinase-like ATPase domain